MTGEKRLNERIGTWRSAFKELIDADEPALRDVVALHMSGKDLIRRMRDDLEQLRDGIVPATGRISPVPGGHSSGHGDPTAAYVERIDDLDGRISDLEKDVDILEAGIRWAINYQVYSKSERDICYMRYVQNLPYTELSKEAGYSEGYCRAVISRCGKLTTCLG